MSSELFPTKIGKRKNTSAKSDMRSSQRTAHALVSHPMNVIFKWNANKVEYSEMFVPN